MTDSTLHEANAAAHEVVKKLRLVREIDSDLDKAFCSRDEDRARAYFQRLGFAQSALDRALASYEDIERRAMREGVA